MDRLHEEIQSDGIRLVLRRHSQGAFRPSTYQSLVTRRSKLRLDELPRHRIVFNDKNPRGFACPRNGSGRLSGLIRSDGNEGERKIETGALAGLAFDPQFAAMQLDEARRDG